MKYATLLCTFVVLAAPGAAYGLDLHNRSGDTLCIAATQDEPDPFDENVARITGGWLCVDDRGTLHVEGSGGALDIAVKRADGTDYVADSIAVKLPRVTSYVPKDEATSSFALEILKHSAGWAAVSWKSGADPWSSYQTVHTVDELPAKLDVLGFRPVEAWRIAAGQGDFALTMN